MNIMKYNVNKYDNMIMLMQYKNDEMTHNYEYYIIRLKII